MIVEIIKENTGDMSLLYGTKYRFVSNLSHLMTFTASTMHLARKQEKQPSRGVLRKRCSGNIQQIYMRTPMHTFVSGMNKYLERNL